MLTLRDEDGNEQTLRVTEEHPFYVDAAGWTPAKSLESGDMLLGADGTLTVVANEHEAHPNGVTVYNLEVEQAHTYFVLAEDATDAVAVWVHNATNYDTRVGTRMGEFNRGNRSFELYEGSQKSGWTHIFERHVDTTLFPTKSKFNSALDTSSILDLLGQTIKRGKESNFHGQSVFEFRTNFERTGYTSYRATVNPDGTVQSFHPLD